MKYLSLLNTDALDICLKRENKHICFLRGTLLKKDFIPYTVHRDLLPTCSTPGVLYGLPKVHKSNNTPARPS